MVNFIKLNFDDFLKRSDHTSDDLNLVLKEVYTGFEGEVWIAGGAVRRTLMGTPLDSDFDFFFKSQEVLEDWESSLPNTLSKIRETKHHKHWRGTLEGSDLPVDIQAIHFKYYSSIEDVLDSFDYTITMFGLEEVDFSVKLVTTPEALWDLGRKRLAVNKVTYPVASMRRLLKYTKQGFTACGGCMSTLYRETARNPAAMSELDVEYVD